MYWDKTLRDGGSNLFSLHRHPNPNIDLRHGHLFRPTSPQGSVSDTPLLSFTAESRLKFFLKQANIDEGETLHSFRTDCALTVAFSGSSLVDVMSHHIGWNNSATASYMKLADVMRAGARADASSFDCFSPSDIIFQVYSEYNHLKDFVLAFLHPPTLH